MTKHLDPSRVAGLAALADGEDAEAREALAHAASCADCTKLVAEAQAVLRWVDRAAVAAPSAVALSRAKQAVFAEMGVERFSPSLPATTRERAPLPGTAPTLAEGISPAVQATSREGAALSAEGVSPRVQATSREGSPLSAQGISPRVESTSREGARLSAEGISPRARLALPIAAVAVFALLMAVARHPAGSPITWGMSLGALALAAACAHLASSGRKIEIALAIAGGAALVALSSRSSEVDWSRGLDCLTIELFGAAVPFAAAVWLVRREKLQPSAALFTGAATAGALTAEAALELTCGSAGSSPHEWAFHFGGLLVAAALAYLFGRRLSRPAPARVT